MIQVHRLFLDDERSPPGDAEEWVIIRSFDAAVQWVRDNQFPSFVSFDNDLGMNSKEGWQFAQWLIERDLDDGSMPASFGFTVHSQNPVRREDIEARLNAYLQFRRGQG